MLSLVGTPIGNHRDLSLRQARTLADSDIILCEDTRKIQILLSKIPSLFSLACKEGQRKVSYYKEKEMEKLPGIISALEERKHVSLVSDAGMPLISDPGYLLLSTVQKRKMRYEVIPGPSAVTTALVASGFRTDRWMFLGFFPKKKGQRRTEIQKMKDIQKVFPATTFVAFESPHRLAESIQMIAQEMPKAEVCICRELSKEYEEVLRGSAQDFIDVSVKGEVTVVVHV